MKNCCSLFALATLCVGSTCYADYATEDPFAYDRQENERERERQEAEAAAAERQSFGNAGDFVISAERLLGFAHTNHVMKQPGPDVEVNVNRLHAFVSPGGDPIGFSAPRLAFDVFVARRLSLGGAFAYGQNSDGNEQRLVVLSPRIGFAPMFGQVVGIWPRLGATYQAQFTKPADSWLLAAGFELPLVLVAGNHAAFTFGPRIDWAFAGKITAAKDEMRTLKAYEVGFSAGLSMFF